MRNWENVLTQRVYFARLTDLTYSEGRQRHEWWEVGFQVKQVIGNRMPLWLYNIREIGRKHYYSNVYWVLQVPSLQGIFPTAVRMRGYTR